MNNHFDPFMGPKLLSELKRPLRRVKTTLLQKGRKLPLGVKTTLLNLQCIAHRKLAGKPFHAMNLEMVEICLFRKNVLLHIRTARQNNDLIQAVLRDQGSKLWNWYTVPCV